MRIQHPHGLYGVCALSRHPVLGGIRPPVHDGQEYPFIDPIEAIVPVLKRVQWGKRKLANSKNLVYTSILPSGKSTILSSGPGSAGCNVSGMPYYDVKSNSEILEKTHVVTTPGSGFGPPSEGFVRVSAFGHQDNVLEAYRRSKELYK
uniref:LL-diaminopimelate aminotransferase, chloroplastic n=1 Tax=Tanacetum cinerariifolium TaxID=118510 RepID=A0A6L2KLI1_TANCI|nr:LL-diaminopimelate aminotransferase, chloroplastic [Tanacetum cinerariifolium]